MQWHPATCTPISIYGTGLPIAGWTRNSLADARVHANALLTQYHDLLGLGTSDFRESIGARMGRTWSFTFDQYFHGLPVIDGRADIRINMIGVVAMLGSQAWPIAANFDTTPRIGEELATAAAWQREGQPTGVPQPGQPGKPRLVIWGDINAQALTPVFLAWEIPVSNVEAQGKGRIGRYYIDAKTGGFLNYHNDKHECGIPGCTYTSHAAFAASAPIAPPIPTTVTVMAWTRTGLDAFSALVNVPLPGLVVSVPGAGVFTTDVNGQFTVDIPAAVNITIGALDGRHHNPIAGVNQPSLVTAVTPGVPVTIQLLTSAATANEAAHTTCSWWVDKANEWVRTILGNTAQMNTADAVAPTVNIASTCNAYYTGNTINFYQAGGGCSNTAFSTVMVHEWGHGIDDRYGGISNNSGDGLSEGWGDIFGLYIGDNPGLGIGFQSAGVPLRNGNNTTMYGTQSEVHAAGEVWMGFAWKYRENLRAHYGTPIAIDVSNDTVIGSIVANATNQAAAVQQVFIADDDDGNLLNGVPHYAELSAAAITKGMPYPQIQLISLAHTALGNTSQQLTPRRVDCTAAVVTSGTITSLQLVFNAGSGTVARNMHPNGGLNSFSAMLPGVLSGAVTYHIEAVHNGTTTVRLPASGEFAYTVTVPTSGPFTPFHTQDFTTPTGWTHGFYSGGDDWQNGPPNGKSGTSLGVAWADPTAAASNGSVYGTDLGAGTSNGAYAANRSYWLRSPAISCTGQVGCFLRFRRWLTVEEGIYDQATIYVNGIQVWTNPLSGHTIDTAWQTLEYPIPMADNSPSVTVEFRLTTDGGLNLGGWNIDDFQLGTKTLVQLPAQLRMLPEQAAQGTPMNATVFTPSSSRPFLLAVADAPGPTFVPGFPIFQVGGNVVLLSGTTDAAGNAAFPFTAPNIPTATGVFFYSQVLTLDAGLANWVVSNAHVNLFTQTP